MRYIAIFIITAFMTPCLLLAQETVSNDTLEEILQTYVAADETGAVVFIDDNGETGIAAYGLANISTNETLQVDDTFRIASASKPMVAVAVLMLVDEGEIGLDDPIADYLPEEYLFGIENAEVATVRQILQMTSGIYSYTDSDSFSIDVEENPSATRTAAEVLDFARNEPASFPAGEGYYYSNTNYILAELLIESVGEVSLAEALSEWIFDPLEMDSCYVETPDLFAQGMARGYMFDDNGNYIDVTEQNDGVGLGDGGVVCAAEDLAKFLPALMGGELLSDDTLAEMLDAVEDDEGGLYGLGIIIYEDSDYGLFVAHDGASSGFQSTMQYLVDEGISVVALTNNFDTDILTDIVLDVLAVTFDEG